jgi:hypothetical protein
MCPPSNAFKDMDDQTAERIAKNDATFRALNEQAERRANRANPRSCALPGHQVAAQGAGRVVEERQGYVIVEKIGRAAEVVRDLDPRSEHR